jgi:uncharacterized protein DUF6790
VISVVLAIAAPIAAAIHRHRRPEPPDSARTLEIYLLWWLVLAIGVAGVAGALTHLLDGPATADLIGFTRGDAGFQVENAFGDMAIGITGLLCIKFRGYFWLAVLLVTTIQYYGDAGGHIYQWLANDNTEIGNVGPPLFLDVIVPAVGLILYGLHQRAEGGAPRQAPAGGEASG